MRGDDGGTYEKMHLPCYRNELHGTAPLRIAFVNTSRGWGGAEEQMLAMSRELERRGHQVTVVARRGGPILERFEKVGHRTLPVQRKGAAALAAPFRAALQARREGFHLIHSHRDHDLPLGKLLSLACGAPLVLTQHCLPHKPLLLAYRLADRLVTVSRYVSAGIQAKLPGLERPLAVIVNGIDPALFAGADRDFWRKHPQAASRTPLIGTVGAFYKGQEELIAILPELLREFPRLGLILIGEDDSRKAPLVESARRLGVEDAVVFAGRIPRENMKHALAGLDLNVSAFRNEGFGLSVVEGLPVGTPFVGYRSGGYPEIVDNAVIGTLVDSAGELRGAIAARLHECHAGKSEACMAKAHSFTLARMVDAYVALYGAARERK